jgi:ABC-type glycerol-3-phosphate transport system substrate-binding protein
MNLDGTGITPLPDYEPPTLPEGQDGYTAIYNMMMNELGDLWVYEQISAYHYDEDGEYVDDGTTDQVRYLSPTGKEKASYDMTEILPPETYFHIQAAAVDGDGSLYVMTIGAQSVIYVINTDGSSFSIDYPGFRYSFTRFGDGTIAVMATNVDNFLTLRGIDKENEAYGADIVVPAEYDDTYVNGSAAYDIYFTSLSALYGYNIEEDERELVVNWLDSDIDSSLLTQIFVKENGEILGVTETPNGLATDYELVSFTAVDPATVPKKEEIIFATFGVTDSLRKRVIEFNKQQSDYRVKVVDYSMYNTNDDYGAGYAKLTTEIGAGNVPDIIPALDLGMRSLIDKGYIEDLTPYIESDPELGMDALVPEIVKAIQIDGKIYMSASAIVFETAVARTDRVGSEMGITYDEAEERFAAMPQGTSLIGRLAGNYRDNSLFNFIYEYIEAELARNPGQQIPSFNNKDFEKMLELVKKIPEEVIPGVGDYFEHHILSADSALLEPAWYAGICDYLELKILSGTPVTMIGIPTLSDERTGSSATPRDAYSMSSTSAHKDAVWEFLRYFYLGESLYTTPIGGENRMFANENGFPIGKKAFDRYIELVTKKEYITDENGEQILQRLCRGVELNDIYPAEQEDVDYIMNVLANLDPIQISNDSEIVRIIIEEVQPYFADQKSVEEVAAIIDSRVNVYMKERG